ANHWSTARPFPAGHHGPLQSLDGRSAPAGNRARRSGRDAARRGRGSRAAEGRRVMSQPVLIGEIRLAEIIDRLAPFDPRSFKEKNSAEQMTYWHERHAALETIGAALRYGELPAHVRDDDQ